MKKHENLKSQELKPENLKKSGILTFLIKEFAVRTSVVPVIELSIYYVPEKVNILTTKT
jgi:hypothetical protein